MSVATAIKRHSANPILTHEQVPYKSALVFNAGVEKWQGRYVMVFRNDYGDFHKTRRFEGTNLGLAWSDDGVAWTVEPEPFMTLEKAQQLGSEWYANRGPEEIGRFYDPRLTVVDGQLLMCFAVDTPHGIRGGIAKVKDDLSGFEEVYSLGAPDNRNMVLFPERIGGDYVRLERPFPLYMGRRKMDMWCNRSPDLRLWGTSDLVMDVEEVPYANDKIGPAAPPVKTDKGWLAVFHAVEIDETRGKHGWEDRWTKVYHAGVCLLDLDDPRKLLGFSKEPILRSETPYEVDGFRGDVIFPTGCLLEGSTVRIWYGGADTVMALAEADVGDLLALCGA
ncbi:MAG: glycoside hydrolase family 130 protein [Planctomycetota bacterium]|jgi:beta-1,4-mannooligosaccharide/beta-1,4-mannosyl-N-acetylglucosamine phosphorylase|nr:glycoside hydrolase family 130 protein [Planctomycetota bacterium]